MEISLSQQYPEVKHDIPVDFNAESVPLHVRKHLYNLDIPLRPWQIRLLRIHPSAQLQSPVICELLVADLVTFPGAGLVDEYKVVEYEALSYSWGYPAFTHSITCNGIPFPVGEALHDALRYLRESDKVRYLWCDACCIDQANPTEKAAQVQTMFIIFQKAHSVLTWLGLPSIEVDYLFTAMRSTLLRRKRERRPADTRDMALTEYLGEDIQASYVSERLRKAALELISTVPYFRRCWVRQELEAAREVIVACGRHTIPFVEFTRLIEILVPMDSEVKFISSVDSETRNLLRYAYFKDGHRPKERRTTDDFDDSLYADFFNRRFFNIILRGAVYESKLPQDRVFSVLSIIATLPHQGSRNTLSELNNLHLKPDDDADDAASRPRKRMMDPTKGFPPVDYTKSVSAVFQDFIKHTINLEKNLDCLCVIQDRGSIGQDLPSWAIDLRVDIPRCLLRYLHEPGTRPENQNFDDRGVLVVRGRRLGLIGSVVTGQGEETTFFEGPIDIRSAHLGDSDLRIADCFTFGRVDPEGGLPQDWETLALAIQKHCNYKWKGVDLDSTRSVMKILSEGWGGPKTLCLAFVSNLVESGDLLVRLQGSKSFFVLRQQGSSERYIFLGPVLVYLAEYTEKMGGTNDLGRERYVPDSFRTDTIHTTMEELTIYGVFPFGRFHHAEPNTLQEIPVEEFLLV